jgi:phospholipid/cholesterol/gamma-HCH transport system substrate-binding protein
MTVTRNRGVLILAAVLVISLVSALVLVLRSTGATHRTEMVAYFDNSNGVFPGDQVRILGVAVGEIDTIEPQPERAKITFWMNDKYKVPADVRAVILSPQLVTARSIELTPIYTGGPALGSGAVIPQQRTAVPVEWDDLRQQLQKLTDALQPTQPGGVSTLGVFVNTTADNLRGQGANIRDTIIKLSQAFSILGDHSGDIVGTVKNLSLLVSALHDSAELMRQLNGNLASATALLANDPDEVGKAISDLNVAVTDVQGFLADNREAIGVASDKISSISRAVVDSIGDVKQLLHIGPNTLQDFYNIYQPAQAALSGALAVNDFANPISFLCGAIQAASRLGAEKSAKLCVQYLAPIIKNRQFNFPPIGENFFVGAAARPNEITYSEDWMRPDYRPPPRADAPPSPGDAPLAAEAPLAGAPPATSADGAPPASVATDPSRGLPGLMVPPGAGS